MKHLLAIRILLAQRSDLRKEGQSLYNQIISIRENCRPNEYYDGNGYGISDLELERETLEMKIEQLDNAIAALNV